MEDIDLPKSIVIECDFFLPGYEFAIYFTVVVWFNIVAHN